MLPTSNNKTQTNSLIVSPTAAKEGSLLYVWIWEQIAGNTKYNNYKIKVSITKEEAIQNTYNSNYQIPIPTRKGHTFDGWYTKEVGGNKITNTTKVTTLNNHTIYAHWK